MATTRQDIRAWFLRGISKNASHMIIVCDSFDYDDYPVFVLKHEDIHAKIAEYNGVNMQKIMEVYKMDLSMEEQISQHRVYNI